MNDQISADSLLRLLAIHHHKGRGDAKVSVELLLAIHLVQVQELFLGHDAGDLHECSKHILDTVAELTETGARSPETGLLGPLADGQLVNFLADVDEAGFLPMVFGEALVSDD